jgi:hypothetical protein
MAMASASEEIQNVTDPEKRARLRALVEVIDAMDEMMSRMRDSVGPMAQGRSSGSWTTAMAALDSLRAEERLKGAIEASELVVAKYRAEIDSQEPERQEHDRSQRDQVEQLPTI